MTTTIKEKNAYAPYIVDIIEQFPAGVPIFTKEIVEKIVNVYGIEIGRAKSIVNTNLNRLNNDNVIKNYRKGIYYKPKQTAFGMSHLNPTQVITKMFVKPTEDEIVGYETGASLMHRLGLTTQMPKYQYIATNASNPRIIDDLKVVIRRPHLQITHENVIYLQVLDIIENKDGVVFDVPKPFEAINNIIEKHKLDYGKLLGIATHYAERVILNLAKVAGNTRI